MKRGGVTRPTCVPYEAAAAFCMLLLQHHGVLTVHFVGMPPGTANILFKFIPPETLQKFGGAARFAKAVDDVLTRLGEYVSEPAKLSALLFGEA